MEIEKVEEAGLEMTIEARVKKALEDLGFEILTFSKVTNYEAKLLSSGSNYTIKFKGKEN